MKISKNGGLVAGRLLDRWPHDPLGSAAVALEGASMPGKYFTTFEASRLLGVSLPTIVNWIKANRLKAHKTPGGHRRISRDDLLQFLRKYQMPVPAELADEVERPLRVLAVDDDPDERELLRAVLEGSGYVVESAANGFEAGLLVGAFKPDAVVMDVMMPQMDGFAALSALRKRDETMDTPVIACTGLSDPASRQRILAAGFDAHVVKPYAPAELLGELERLLAHEGDKVAKSR